MAQRSSEDTISQILQSAGKGATQTTLMYETYLSHGALKEFLVLLLKKGLLEYLAGERKFRTTTKGLALLSSKIPLGGHVCSHQCKKCGVIYRCERTTCQDPFQHAVCKQCVWFLGSHNINNAVQKLQTTTLLD